jgi:hypothetical protein
MNDNDDLVAAAVLDRAARAFLGVDGKARRFQHRAAGDLSPQLFQVCFFHLLSAFHAVLCPVSAPYSAGAKTRRPRRARQDKGASGKPAFVPGRSFRCQKRRQLPLPTDARKRHPSTFRFSLILPVAPASGMAGRMGKTACGLQLCQQPGPKGDANLFFPHGSNCFPKPRSEPAQRCASHPVRSAFGSRPRSLQIVQITIAAGKIPIEPLHDVGKPMKVDFLMR